MKTLRYAIPIFFFAILFIPSALFAQANSVNLIALDSALEAVRAEYGADVFILEAQFESDTNDSQVNCWKFELLLANDTDSTMFAIIEVNVCADVATGELVLSLDDMSDDNDDNNRDDNDTEEIITPAPAITLDNALITAREVYPDGDVTSIELKNKNSILVWNVEFGNDSRSVDVSAESGEVLQFGNDDHDDDDHDDDDHDDDHDDDDHDDDDHDDDDD